MESEGLISKSSSKRIPLPFIAFTIILSIATILFVVLFSVYFVKYQDKTPEVNCEYYDSLRNILDPSNHLFRDNRNKVLDLLKQNSTGNNAIFIQGDTDLIRNDDVTYVFRQNSNFLYLTGMEFPDMSLIMIESTGQAILIVPEATTYYATWIGVVKSREQIQTEYDFDVVIYPSQINETLSQFQIDTLFTFPNTPLPFTGNFTINTSNLTYFLYESRTVKTPQEISLMEQVALIGSEGHRYAMRNIPSNNNVSEFQIETLFLFICQRCSMKHQAYPPIIAGNNRSAILHYIENNRFITPYSLVLVDAGPEFNGYGTDITRTWPVNGVFSDIQKELYEAVLYVQQESIAILKPELTWSNLSSFASNLIVEQLYSLNVFTSSLRDYPQYVNTLMRVFYPHGLGHLIGLDVHDTYSSPPVLKSGMVITIEPGIYFNRVLFEQNVLKNDTLSQFINQNRVNQFLEVGGVRIEDVVLITDTSSRILSNAPRTVEEIEKWMK